MKSRSGARLAFASGDGKPARADDCIRLNVRLVDASTGVQLWAERYHRQLGALFEVQDEVTQRIASMLIGHLRRAEINAALQKPPERLDAYDLYLRGVAALWAADGAGSTSGRSIAEARNLLQQSLAADPRYAPAWLMVSITFMSTWGTRRHEPSVAAEYRQAATMEQALQCAARAVSLDPSLPPAHAQHGWCLHWTYRRDEAIGLSASTGDQRQPPRHTLQRRCSHMPVGTPTRSRLRAGLPTSIRFRGRSIAASSPILTI